MLPVLIVVCATKVADTASRAAKLNAPNRTAKRRAELKLDIVDLPFRTVFTNEIREHPSQCGSDDQIGLQRRPRQDINTGCAACLTAISQPAMLLFHDRFVFLLVTSVYGGVRLANRFAIRCSRRRGIPEIVFCFRERGWSQDYTVGCCLATSLPNIS